ncbi:hypothetical protein LCGC14_2017280 [marine sediment metagenome]|uniref:Uncharacterized protein n=1 Tax=marine sediment metagenome TaxID=412755 RepID=A0A0F9EYM4_9ZZZZ
MVVDNGSIPDWVLAYWWAKNPPRKPNRPLEAGDCWQSDDDTEMHYVDSNLLERYLPL